MADAAVHPTPARTYLQPAAVLLGCCLLALISMFALMVEPSAWWWAGVAVPTLAAVAVVLVIARRRRAGRPGSHSRWSGAAWVAVLGSGACASVAVLVGTGAPPALVAALVLGSAAIAVAVAR
jgi:hypothetical protein